MPAVPAARIVDAPRYAHRGLLLDVARNVLDAEAIMTIVEQMAALRLTVLLLHLTDDEGWRLAIPGLPELTEVGARRGHDPSESAMLGPQLGSGRVEVGTVAAAAGAGAAGSGAATAGAATSGAATADPAAPPPPGRPPEPARPGVRPPG
jgi:hypothetical protein